MNPALGYLEFIARWEGNEEMAAYEMSASLRKRASTYSELRELAPDGSEEWRLFVRSLASFEDEAKQIRRGSIRADLVLEGWWGLPQAWQKVEPYVVGWREAVGDPNLYEGFEWLAGFAEQHWKERDATPPTYRPLEGLPTADDEQVLQAFAKVWSAPEVEESFLYFAELEAKKPLTDELLELLEPGSKAWSLFERVCCLYDQAGVLIRAGAMHPQPFLASRRSPTEVWRFAEGFTRARRQQIGAPALYEGLEWLAEFETAQTARATSTYP